MIYNKNGENKLSMGAGFNAVGGDGKWQVEKPNKQKIEEVFKNVMPFRQDGFARVQTEDGNWRLLNIDGKIIQGVTNPAKDVKVREIFGQKWVELED